MITQVGYSVTGRSWRQETRVSWLNLKTKVDGLSVVWPKNHWHNFLRFGLKIGGDSFLGSTSKSRVTVFRFGPQNWQLRFSDWDIKITVTVLCLTIKTNHASVC
jgi:hypothetical protein